MIFGTPGGPRRIYSVVLKSAIFSTSQLGSFAVNARSAELVDQFGTAQTRVPNVVVLETQLQVGERAESSNRVTDGASEMRTHNVEN